MYLRPCWQGRQRQLSHSLVKRKEKTCDIEWWRTQENWKPICKTLNFSTLVSASKYNQEIFCYILIFDEAKKVQKKTKTKKKEKQSFLFFLANGHENQRSHWEMKKSFWALGRILEASFCPLRSNRIFSISQVDVSKKYKSKDLYSEEFMCHIFANCKLLKLNHF